MRDELRLPAAPRPRVAVVGAGVAGLAAAWALRDTAEVTLLEAQGRLGGHACTVDIDYDGRRVAVDVGFIVFNPHNYPNLCALFDHLGVESRATDMSFGFSTPGGLEWCSSALGLFAQTANVARPSFLAMLGDVVRFNAQARRDLREERLGDVALGDYLRLRRFGAPFQNNYLLPMGAAIWSTTARDMLAHPAQTVVRFFENHHLLDLAGRPRWRTVVGGSRTYVDRLATALGPRARIGRAVRGVARDEDGVRVRLADGEILRFDEAILACRSDEALALLEDPSGEEVRLLGAIRTTANRAVLHRDPSFMPRARGAWAAWNYRVDPEAGGAQVTYDMNRLQAIAPDAPLYVTLNPTREPRAGSVFAAFDFAHPRLDGEAVAAQRVFNRVQGVRRTWFAGAWLGYGFHEDGLRAGLRVALRLGGRIPWTLAEGDVDGGRWGERPGADARASAA